MNHPNHIRVREARCIFKPTPFRAPLKFGGRVVDGSETTEITVTVETGSGRVAEGHGSMPLGNVWGWPSAQIGAHDTAEATRRLALRATAWLEDRGRGRGDAGHPLDLGADLDEALPGLAAAVVAEMDLPEPMPAMMALVAASPVDAALHDAFGKAHDRNVYACYGPEFVGRDLSAWLGPEFAGAHLSDFVRAEPLATMPLYHLVGALDPLTADDVAKPIGDGLPETLAEWIRQDGLTHLKIKLNGDDPDWDAARVIAVNRVADAEAARRGHGDWRFSLDFNERCDSAAQVLDLFDRLRAEAPAALERVQYVEQPTARDLAAHPEATMHAVAAVRPVVIDESLTGLDSLKLARERGYSGVALKTCKGHGPALLMATYARRHGLFLCVQDLTCPGTSFLHSAGLAARIPGVAAIEGNGRQYCPAGNVGWADRYPDTFHPRRGVIRTGVLDRPGLGH